MSFDRTRLKIAAYLVTGIWFVALLITGVQLPGIWSKIVTSAPLIVSLVFALFDNWLWQARGVKGLVRRPTLAGTWQGELVSLRSDNSSSEIAHAPIPIFLVIRQTFLTMSVTMISAESKSRSIGAILQRNESDDFTVFYHYDNTPTMEFRGSSPRHAGGSTIDVAGLEPGTLKGEYWTDRRTRGHFEVHKVSTRHHSGGYDELVRGLEAKP